MIADVSYYSEWYACGMLMIFPDIIALTVAVTRVTRIQLHSKVSTVLKYCKRCIINGHKSGVIIF